MSRYAQTGDRIKIHYVCKLEDGSIVDSTKQEKEFILGRNQALPGLDKGITGMQVGERRQISVSPTEGYGHYLQDLISEIPRSELIKDPKKGQRIVLTTQRGKPVHAKILEVLPNSLIIDVNHPLAGKKLLFDVVLMEIAQE